MDIKNIDCFTEPVGVGVPLWHNNIDKISLEDPYEMFRVCYVHFNN